eukprot:m.54672 g.54672  ORF g.54672 m.54672 type:complete len:74 (-) comp15520_c0_seq9:3192-3413(-)
MASTKKNTYGSYSGDTPRIALVLTPLDDKNLRLAAQIGATDVVYYNMNEMPTTAEALTDVRKVILVSLARTLL